MKPNYVLISNICNLANLYYRCKGERVDPIKTARNIIKDICDNEFKITTQHSYLSNRDIAILSNESPIILSNVFYSGCEFATARYVNNILEDVTCKDIINLSVNYPKYISHSRIPNLLYDSIDVYDTINKTSLEYILLDSYIVLNNIGKYSKQISRLIGFDEEVIHKVCKEEIEFYSKEIFKQGVTIDVSLGNIKQCEYVFDNELKETDSWYTEYTKDILDSFFNSNKIDNLITIYS